MEVELAGATNTRAYSRGATVEINSRSEVKLVQWGAPRPSIEALKVLPEHLRMLRAWLVWRLQPSKQPGGKPRKQPFYINGQAREGTLGSIEDRARLASFDAALVAYSSGGFDGLGLAMLQENNVVALDFDGCIDGGQVDSRVSDLTVGTYSEVSPSGRGVRAFYWGYLPDLKDNTPKDGRCAIEYFHGTGFVTVTGAVTDQCRLFGYEGNIAELPDSVRADHGARTTRNRTYTKLEVGGTYELDRVHVLMTVDDLTLTDLKSALEWLANRGVGDDYSAWQEIGQALKSLGARGLPLNVPFANVKR